MKHATSSTTYAILTKRVKLQHEKKHESNLKSIKSTGFEHISRKYLEIFVLYESFLCRERNP